MNVIPQIKCLETDEGWLSRILARDTDVQMRLGQRDARDSISEPGLEGVEGAGAGEVGGRAIGAATTVPRYWSSVCMASW